MHLSGPGDVLVVVTHLHHGDHTLIGDRVCADTEVPRGVPTDDSVDCIPVG